jgi:hypothetical protein
MLGAFLRQTHNEGIPIEQRRGIEHTDLNDYLILVKAPIEQVGQALCQMLPIACWKRDVYQRQIEIVEQGSALIFKFPGHPWTIIQPRNFLPNSINFQDKEAQSISGLLQTKVISYLISDTGGYIGYQFFNCGKFLEKLYKEPPEEMAPIEYESEVWEEEFIGMCEFRSQLRQTEVYEIGDGYKFTDDFLREQDAYVPSFKWTEFLEVGQKVTIKLKYLAREDLESMDYMTLT